MRHTSDEDEDPDSPKVTASHAIFPRDGGIEAPGSVVGFQFSHELMYKRFMEITSKANVWSTAILNNRHLTNNK